MAPPQAQGLSKSEQRIRTSRRLTCGLAFALFVALLAGFGLFLWLAYRAAYLEDFSRRSPRFSYRFFFGQGMTPDVTGFRAFGRSTFEGSEAGATFNASPTTIGP